MLVSSHVVSGSGREVADPAQSQAGKFNPNGGGRGFYFEDPNGHFLEVITRTYASGDRLDASGAR
jgi:hypothetical protein